MNKHYETLVARKKVLEERLKGKTVFSPNLSSEDKNNLQELSILRVAIDGGFDDDNSSYSSLF